MLHAERVDRAGLLRLDDEVLADLPILVAALHDGAGENEDRHLALVLDDERVDAAAVAELADLGGLRGERVVEGDERADVDLRARRHGKDDEVAERRGAAERMIVRARGRMGGAARDGRGADRGRGVVRAADRLRARVPGPSSRGRHLGRLLRRLLSGAPAASEERRDENDGSDPGQTHGAVLSWGTRL